MRAALQDSSRALCRCPEHLRAEFPSYHNSGALGKAPLAIRVPKRLRTTQVVYSILFDQVSHVRCLVGWRLGIGHPALNDLVQMTRGDMANL
jgi:hypothetical protein